MANLASVLKEEIGRVARREVRQQSTGPAKSAAQNERDIATLKRQVQELQQRLASLTTQEPPKQTASKKKPSKKKPSKKKTPAAGKTAPSKSPGQPSRALRFSAAGLKSERNRLGLSADNYGKLIGVSGLSIYNWEQKKAHPRESSVAVLQQMKGIGKREATRRLEALKQAKAQKGGPEKAATGKDATGKDATKQNPAPRGKENRSGKQSGRS